MDLHRVGLIGCGWVAPFHLAGLSQVRDRARVVWVADPVRERAERLASEAGARALTDYRDGLAEIDCAFVLLPHHLHHPVTLECLAAGCHVLLEKPIATSLAHADEMVAAADRSGRTFMVAYPWRYRRSTRFLKEVVDSGRYGRLFMLDGAMDEALGAYVSGWITRRQTLGGGVLFSSSPHLLDVMLYLAGPARGAWMVGTRGGVEMEGEDTAACVIKFASGAIGVTRHTWASPGPRVWYTMQAVCQRARVTLTVHPQGDLASEGHRCRWHSRLVAQGERDEVLLESDEGLDLGPEIEHFLDCVDTRAVPQTGGRAAREVIALVLGAYQRAAEMGANV